MNPALILLLRMRFWGWLRRMGRKLGTAKGLLLTLVGMAIFVPMVLGSLLEPKGRAGPHMIEGFQRFGPLFFLLYCVLILLFSPGEKAFAFSPAEVSFLFPAPFSRRSLLAYKIGGNLALTVLSGIFFTFVFRQYWSRWYAGYLGLVLTFAFLQLFQIGVTVIGQAVGAAATTWRRRLAVGLIVGFVGVTMISVRIDALRNFNLETIQKLEHAPVVRAAMAPFRPFVLTISANRVWPNLIGWGALALAIDAALIGAILLMDAQYLEAAAASSERFYAKLERMRKGGPSISSFGKKKNWKGLPSLPWLGGAGPVAWRQLTCASRDFARGLVPMVASVAMAILGIALATITPSNDGGSITTGLGVSIVALALVLTNLLTFDFRGDFERMEGLKTLPIRPSRLVLGQLAAPWALLAGSQVFALTLLAIGAGPVPTAYWALLAFAPMLDLLMLEIDNLLFLLFPSKPMSHTPGDVQAMGRMMVMMISKLFVLAVTLGLAALFGFIAYLVGGWVAAGIIAWMVMAGMIALFVPLVALAFNRFDVASETPS